MNPNLQPTFSGGGNIALKIPQFRFVKTIAFYRDTLQLPYLGQRDTSPAGVVYLLSQNEEVQPV